jgi:ornithine carbamoyltransferase
MAPRHFLDIDAFDAPTLAGLTARAHDMKADLRDGGRRYGKLAEGKVLAMMFEKPSTRTRVSFDVAMRKLGGEAIVLNSGDMQLGRGETIADTARVLSRYVDVMNGQRLRYRQREHWHQRRGDRRCIWRRKGNRRRPRSRLRLLEVVYAPANDDD